MNRHHWLACIAALPLIYSGTALSQELARVRESGKLTALCFPHQNNRFCRVDITKGPLVSPAKADRFKGLDIDILQLFATSLGVELEIQSVREPGYGHLVPDLLEGRGDLILGGFSVTPKRSELVDFTRPYHSVRSAIIAKRKVDIAGIEDLARLKGCVMKGSSDGDRFRAAGIPAERLQELEFVEDACDLIAEGKVDYWISEVDVSGGRPPTSLCPDPSFGIVYSFPEIDDFAYAVRKGSDLLPELNRFLDRLEQSGEIDRLSKLHLGS